MAVNPDLFAAAAHRNMIAHISGPLAAGAGDAPVPLAVANGALDAVVDWTSREPLLLVAPALPLDADGLRVEAVLDPDGAAAALPSVEFAPYTEAGAFLPLHLPPTDAASRTAGPFRVRLTVAVLPAGGPPAQLAAADAAQRLQVRLLEGVFGRMLYVLGAEQARVRRQARETMLMRRLAHARDAALDRHGASLGVPRFGETLAFDQPSGQITTQDRREPDDEYRVRLALYSGWAAPSPGRVRELLNGPGAPGDPNRGLLAKLGVQARFDLVEGDNTFAVAVHVIEAGAPARRDNFLEHVRRNYLVLPRATAATNGLHADRFYPEATKAEVNALRARLRANFGLPVNPALSPALAGALDRLSRVRLALSPGAAAWNIQRVQDGGAGSRYELGLGADLDPLPAAELDALQIAANDANRARTNDAEAEAIITGLQPLAAADDPEGAWLIGPCGLRTVHRAAANTLYVSHFPAFGLVVTGAGAGPAPTSVAPGAQVDLEARFHAPGDPGANAALAGGLAQAAAAWATGGNAPWIELNDAAAVARWDAAPDLANNAPALGVMRAAGLPAINLPKPVVARLKLLPPELHTSLALDAALAGRVFAGDPAAADELRGLADTLRAAGFASVLPLVTGAAELLVVASVIGLPEAGLNLSDRRSAGFRWYVVPLDGGSAEIKVTGSRTFFTARAPGLYAIVAIGYARRGLTDPYEYRVELPDGAMLSLLQYEFLMNSLDRAFPIGVEINTFTIRRGRVDLDGDGVAEPLPPRVSRSFRPFRRRRIVAKA